MSKFWEVRGVQYDSPWYSHSFGETFMAAGYVTLERSSRYEQRYAIFHHTESGRWPNPCLHVFEDKEQEMTEETLRLAETIVRLSC